MLHIFLSLLLVGLSLVISLRRYGVPIGYLTLSWVPLFLLLIASGYQTLFGFKRFAEVIYHFSYDTSYILSLTGIVLLLTSIFRRTLTASLVLAVLLSALPIFLLLLRS